MKTKVLEIQNLTITFDGKKAVDDLSLELYENEIVGLVGESGCGKSLTAYSVLGILPLGGDLSGKIFFKDTNLSSLDEESKRKIRGDKISLIPQDPLSALNPVFTIGDQIAEVLETHKNISYSAALQKSQAVLESVNISNPSERLKDYPHQFSGGMKQRALIAMSLVAEPEVLIADEPTTALDVTIQLQILELMKNLKNKRKTILLVTHDLAVVSEICDRVYVMYLGKIVESGSLKEIFTNPKHPYTIGLLNSLPDENKTRLNPIIGQPPSIDSIPNGCAFHPRCPFIFDRCKTQVPNLYDVKNLADHKSRCFLEVENKK